MTKYKLGEITKIKTGKLDANASSSDGIYPFFTCSKEPLKIDSYSYDCECVLVAGNGDLNVKYYKGRFDAYQRTYIIEDNSDGRLFMPYLFFFLDLYVEELRKQSIGGVIKYIKLGNLTNASINLPSIEDQKSIVNILEKSKSIVEYKNTQLSDYDQLIKSRFVEMFMEKDYPRMKMNSVSKGKGEYGAGSASILYDSTRPRYVRITDINDDGTLNNDFVSSINQNDDNTYRLEYGDFMFARMGATVGKTYAYLDGNQIYAGYLIRYRLDNNLINPRYLFYYTKMKEYKEWVKSNQSGAAQPGINAKKYGFLEVPVAPIELQNKFADLVQQVDKLKFKVQKSLDETQILFDSLMQEYFG